MLLRPLFFTLLIALSSSCAAQLIPGYRDSVYAMDPRDIALLPPYCRYTQHFRDKLPGGIDEKQQRRWAEVLGPDFLHMHHYCYGLMNANRGILLATTPLAKNHYLNDAVVEFDYVLSRAEEQFVLLPEVFARRGQVQLHLGHVVAGTESIEKAISIKPDYWMPYAMASDFYKVKGDVERAREWLRRGLQASPRAQPLESRLAGLGEVSGPRK